jgi:hypothetical protein
MADITPPRHRHARRCMEQDDKYQRAKEVFKNLMAPYKRGLQVVQEADRQSASASSTTRTAAPPAPSSKRSTSPPRRRSAPPPLASQGRRHHHRDVSRAPARRRARSRRRRHEALDKLKGAGIKLEPGSSSRPASTASRSQSSQNAHRVLGRLLRLGGRSLVCALGAHADPLSRPLHAHRLRDLRRREGGQAGILIASGTIDLDKPLHAFGPYPQTTGWPPNTWRRRST